MNAVRGVLVVGAFTLAAAGCGDGGAGRTAESGGVREVDFGFVELVPGRPIAITSYKYGKTMVVYGGEELEYQAFGDGPLPALELHLGKEVRTLEGASGRVKIDLPRDGPMPARMIATGSRLSLPGGAPPRISVKVQVHGTPRPR